MSIEAQQVDLRTPLKRVRGLGSAKSGTHHFIVQRVTAIALIPLVVWAIWLALMLVRADYAQAHALVHQPCNALLMVVFIIAVFWHAQLGVQVVIEDYVHTHWLALTSQVLVRFACVLGGFACVLAVARIALGNA
ncbi:MAG: succinate dehydrogenase, hydrophobic membrane anchor protein [Rudaea sp.]